MDALINQSTIISSFIIQAKKKIIMKEFILKKLFESGKNNIKKKIDLCVFGSVINLNKHNGFSFFILF